MSRKRSEEKTGLSPIQRKACVVMAFCVLAEIGRASCRERV